jgi:type I restriction enzyme, S subunit
VTTPIGDLCDLANGKAFKPSDWAREGLPIIRIQNLNRPDADFNYFHGELDARFIVEPNELLFAWSGTPGTSFGAHIWSGPKAILNQHIFRMRFDEKCIDKSFFKGAINSKLEELIGEAHGGVGLAHVTKGRFERTEIALPPLAEQRRIVAKLDTLTAGLTRARAELDRVPRLAKRFCQAALAEMYSRTTDGVVRESIPLSSYCLSVTDGDHQAPPRADRGIPFITISAINNGHVDLAKATRFVPAEYLEGLKATRKAQVGDVLYSVTGSFGIPALVRGEEPFVFQRHIALLRPDPLKCDAHWLAYVMAAPQVFEQARAVATGTAQLTVPLSGLRVIQLPRMDLGEQRKISTKLDDIFARAGRLEAEAALAHALLDRLEAAILTKAFKGQLVPQHPNDEPASLLLDRLRNQRAATPKAKPDRSAAA